MKKYVIYIDSDLSFEEILEKIQQSPDYQNPIFVFFSEDSVKILLNKCNLELLSKTIQELKREVVLVSDNITLFKLASAYQIKVQNVLDDEFSFDDVIITKKKIWDNNPEKIVSYSLWNLNETIA